MKKALLILLALVFILAGCGSKNKDARVIKIGLTGSESKTWSYVKEQAAKQNIDLELVFFDSYPLPNKALASGDIDINAFQHYAYLQGEIDEFGYDLSVIGETYYAPIGLYSKSITALSELKDGDTIVIPDDVTNGGRSLLLLETAGLIEVDDAAGRKPTLNDITANPHNYKIVEMSAANTPNALQEAPLAAINSGYATDAGFIPSEDAIVLEQIGDSGDNPYINVIVVRTEDKDDEDLNELVKLFQTDEVKKIIEEDYKGSLIPVW